MINDNNVIRLGSAIAFDKENPDRLLIQLNMGPMQFNLTCFRSEFRQLLNQWEEALKNAPSIALPFSNTIGPYSPRS